MSNVLSATSGEPVLGYNPRHQIVLSSRRCVRFGALTRVCTGFNFTRMAKFLSNLPELRLLDFFGPYISPFRLAIGIILFGGAVAQATTYYMATNGNNGWDGSAPAYISGTAGPWRTLSRAASIMVSNDVLYIRGGFYDASTNVPGQYLYLSRK